MDVPNIVVTRGAWDGCGEVTDALLCLLAGLGTAYDEDHTLLIAWPAQRALVVVDLTVGTSRIIPWLPGVAGPADLVIR